MFEEADKRSLPQQELDVLQFWNQEKLFERSLEQRQGCPRYTFYDGPPFATGLPHYGHLLASTIKDAVCRFMTMKGYQVPRRFGWDCHGLPIESLVEKQEGLRAGSAIREYGIAKFNQLCRQSVLKYTSQWRQVIARIGRWVDMDKTYQTMDPSFMESVWWVFKRLFDEGLVYKGYKVMPFSWQLGTALSNFEAAENYQVVDDPSLVVSFQDAQQPDLYYLAWTTTPWTLVSNMALVVGSQIEYLQVASESKQWIVAKARLPELFKNRPYEVVRSWGAQELQGRRYKPLFDDFAHQEQFGAFRILVADFVSTEDGTGIVHAAPAFGEEDFEVCRKHQVPLVCPINEHGLFDHQVARYEGLLWKDCQKQIIRELKSKGQLFSQATISHRYPFCYRTDTPLIYRATDTWFIHVERIKDRLVKNNRLIHWVPGHIQEGRFGKWLENAKDWAISRNRFWGTPIPLWQSEDGQLLAIGSRQELEELSGTRLADLHREFIDDLVIYKDGRAFRRIDAVFDCWFESGAMPYAQNHYPFENREQTQESLPADFIAEGLDQTRGWFYTLHVLACALFDKPAFKNVIVNGIVLAADGSKMSKRLQNYPDPMELLERYGADALRLYLLKSPVVRAEDLAFHESGVEQLLKQVLLPWSNAYSFLSTYAKLYEWKPQTGQQPPPECYLDRWILSRLQTLIQGVEGAMHSYQLWEAMSPLIQFIEELTNWYIRRSRRRFWSEDAPADRAAAMHTLQQLLLTLCQLAAPFAPFLAESLWQKLRDVDQPISVHLCEFPHANPDLIDPALEKTMAAVQKLASMGHALRKEQRLRVRQPLKKAWVVDISGALGSDLASWGPLLQEELNVKQICLQADTSELLKIQFKPNFKQLGPRAGKQMKALRDYIEQLDLQTYKALQAHSTLQIPLGETSFELHQEDVTLSYQLVAPQAAIYQDGLAIALETELDEPLLLEGMARELINKINTLRKEKQLWVSDRISLTMSAADDKPLSQQLQAMLAVHEEQICEETLCVQIELTDSLDLPDKSFEIAQGLLSVKIEKLIQERP